MSCPTTHAMFMVGGITNKTGTEKATRELSLFIPEKDLFCELSIKFPVNITAHATHGFTVCGGYGTGYPIYNPERCRTLDVTTGMWIDPSWVLCPDYNYPRIWGSKDGLILVESTKTGLLQPKSEYSNSHFNVSGVPNFNYNR